METALAQLKKRLPGPSSALIRSESLIFRRECDLEILCDLATLFPNKFTEIEMSDLFAELYRLAQLKKQGDIESGADHVPLLQSPREKQLEIKKICDKLAKILLVMPYSSAGIERDFSWMNDTVTTKRNRLSTAALRKFCFLSKRTVQISKLNKMTN